MATSVTAGEADVRARGVGGPGFVPEEGVAGTRDGVGASPRAEEIVVVRFKIQRLDR